MSGRTSAQLDSGQSPWAGSLEVLIMVGEMSPVLPVDELTSLFYILGHARGAAAEHPNLPDLLEKEVKASSPHSLNPWAGVVPAQYVSQLSAWAWESDT